VASVSRRVLSGLPMRWAWEVYFTRTGEIITIGLNEIGTRSVAAGLRIPELRTLHRGDAVASTLATCVADDGPRR
jgi:hypothetical protein